MQTGRTRGSDLAGHSGFAAPHRHATAQAKQGLDDGTRQDAVATEGAVGEPLVIQLDEEDDDDDDDDDDDIYALEGEDLIKFCICVCVYI